MMIEKKITYSESVDEASQEHLDKKRVRKIRYVYYEEFIHHKKVKRKKMEGKRFQIFVNVCFSQKS